MKSIKSWLKMEELVDGELYYIASRNLSTGVWHAEDKCFTGLRTKFGTQYEAREFHYDTGAPFGTAKPIKKV